MLDTLEALHRISWRCAVLVFAMSTMMGFASAPASADDMDTKVSNIKQWFQNSLVSKETVKAADAVKETPKKEVVAAQTKSIAKKSKNPVLPELSEDDERIQGTMKSVKGTVAGRDNYGVAIEYGSDGKAGALEMWAALNSKTKLSGIRSISDLEMGDIAEVKFKESFDGRKKIIQSVALLQRKPAESMNSEAVL